MEKIINSFRGQYFFLSNFYMTPVTYDGITYTNNEAAFQAQKCENSDDRKAFASLNPSDAKKRGRRVKLRKDWETVKRPVMYGILKAKFEQNPVLRILLLATGTAHLEEGNTWGDRTWGTVNGVGENWLGKLLMQVRTESIKFNELIVLERANGWYGGYQIRNGNIDQVFNTDKSKLFFSIKQYTDEGCSLTCLDKSCEELFMKGRNPLQILAGRNELTIWRYEEFSACSTSDLSLRVAIATVINPHNYNAVILSGDYAAIVIEKGQAKGVYEITSGAFMAETVEQANAYIEIAGDDVLKQKMEKNMIERDKANVVFGSKFGLEV